MTHLEMVEKLRSLSELSYEEAKAVLERNNWDILDAMVELERSGKSASGADYTTPEKKTSYFQADAARKPKDSSFRRACRWLRSLVKKSCRNFIAAVRGNDTILELPIIAFIILLLACFWVVVPVMLISLFLDVRYTITGPNVSGTRVASVVEKVSEKTAETAGNVVEKVSDVFDRQEK